jgi:hypothetical protein
MWLCETVGNSRRSTMRAKMASAPPHDGEQPEPALFATAEGVAEFGDVLMRLLACEGQLVNFDDERRRHPQLSGRNLEEALRPYLCRPGGKVERGTCIAVCGEMPVTRASAAAGIAWRGRLEPRMECPTKALQGSSSRITPPL